MSFELFTGLSLVLLGLMYQIMHYRKEIGSMGIGFFVGAFLISASFSSQDNLSLETIKSGLSPFILVFIVLALILNFVITKKSLNILAWLSLLFPLGLLLIPETEEGGINAFSALQVMGLGIVFPLIVHFVTAFMASFSIPRETPVVIHKQHIALLLSVAILGFFVIVGNFVLGKDSFLLLAIGIFVTALTFTEYKLNGQRVFPALVAILSGFYVFQSFQVAFAESINLSSFQMVSGLLFGLASIFGAALTLSWSKDTTGGFSKLLLIKSIVIPLVFVFLSGWLFFVYEAFGGRTSLVMTCLGAILALPLVNFLFTNLSYGAFLLVFGLAQIILPKLEHKKATVEVVQASDEMKENLQKLTVTNADGSQQTTELNDLAVAAGTWKIDGENSIIEFKVHGEESITDGFFQNFSGSLKIEPDFQKSVLSVVIPIAQISTYNRVRDKSIREDEIFFDEEQFPSLTYEVNALSADTSGYLADGLFTMKGISAKVPTKLKLKSKGTIGGKEALILEGTGELDRSSFGQTNDEGIGNRVTFNFKVLYLKD